MELVAERGHLREAGAPAGQLDHEIPVPHRSRQQRHPPFEIAVDEGHGADVDRHVQRFEAIDQRANRLRAAGSLADERAQLRRGTDVRRRRVDRRNLLRIDRRDLRLQRRGEGDEEDTGEERGGRE
jgi:hypothetical protein